MKHCPVCEEDKELTEFHRCKNSPDGRFTYCKECRADRYRGGERWSRYKARNNRYQSVAEYQDNIIGSRLQTVYGISLSDYEKLLDNQGGVCAICEGPPTKNRLSVDHDHKTGEVRGLLCERCNTIIGRAEDRTDIIQNAIWYLKKML